MKARNSFNGLVIAVMAITFAPPLVYANISDLLEMSEKMDKADKQDLLSIIDKANACTRARNFSCSDEQLRKAAKLVNGSNDKQALNAATLGLQAEKKQVKDEAIAKAENERQIRLAEERAEEERQQARRRREREEEEDSAPSVNSSEIALKKSLDDLRATTNKWDKHWQNKVDQGYREQQEKIDRQNAERREQAREDAERRERNRAERERLERNRADIERREKERASSGNTSGQSSEPEFITIKNNTCREDASKMTIESGRPPNSVGAYNAQYTCEDREQFKQAFNASDMTMSDQSKMCTASKESALREPNLELIKDFGCSCNANGGMLHCGEWMIFKRVPNNSGKGGSISK